MKKIFDIYPQMEFYYDPSITKKRFVPYAMMTAQNNFENKCIKTCSRGFRISTNGNAIFSVDQIDKYESINILIGGSTVFGVGSTSNEKTIPSLLSSKTNSVWLNLGIRAGNSFSEYINLINLLHKAKKIENIVFLSGLNDLYLSYLFNNETDFDPGFFPDYSKSKDESFFKKTIGFLSNKFLNKKTTFSKEINKSSELILENYKKKYQRNFQLISSLENAFSCRIMFVLQPFSSWSNKIFSKNESRVFDLLSKLQHDSDWAKIKDLMGQKSIYKKVDTFFEILSKKYNLKYIDSNKYFSNTKNDCFVDSVHLSDSANKLITELIYNEKDS